MKSSSQRLGDILLEAREARGLSLDDLVEKTDVRRSYLIALESGRYEALPEADRAKKALRLYAQSVGLDVTRTLHIYRQEQRRAELGAVAGVANETSSVTSSEQPKRERAAWVWPSMGAFGRLATTLMLVAGVVVVALWGFNTLLFQPRTYSPVATGTPETASSPAETRASTAASTAASTPAPRTTASDLILLSVTTTPPGAEVRLDGFPFDAPSPILDAPVSAGAGRTVRVSLAGYESVEQRLDLTRNRNLNISLSATTSPTNAASDENQEVAENQAVGERSAAGTAVFKVDAPAWLEVYRGSTRGGERLYYSTAEPGETLTFDLPVYVHTGNGGGVSLAVDGENRGTLGTPGQVTGRALP